MLAGAILKLLMGKKIFVSLLNKEKE